MEVRISLLLIVAAVTGSVVTFASGKPIIAVPVDPEVEPARESDLLVSKCFCRRHIQMIYIYAIQIYDFYDLYSIGIIAIQLCARLLFSL